MNADRTTQKLKETTQIKAKVEGGKTPYTYAWDGDVKGKGTNVKFVPSKAGKHKITLTVKDNLGKSASADIEIKVEAEKLELTLKPEKSTLKIGETIKIMAQVKGGQPVYTYTWGPDVVGKGKTARFKPKKAGDFKLTLDVTDELGTRKHATVNVKVKAPKPKKATGYNPLNDPSLKGSKGKNIDLKKVNDLVKNFNKESPGYKEGTKSSGAIGGDTPVEQSEAYTKGSIGAKSPRKPDKQPHGHPPDNDGTNGLSSVTVNSRNISITFWDHKKEDGDIINIYLNNRLLKGNIRLTKTRKSFPVQLNSGKNLFEVEAVNVGSVPPNTASVHISNVTAGQDTQISKSPKGKKASMNLHAP